MAEDNPAPADQHPNDKVISDIARILNENNIGNALICFNTESAEPVVFFRGEIYKIAKMASKVAGTLKQQVINDLDSM